MDLGTQGSGFESVGSETDVTFMPGIESDVRKEAVGRGPKVLGPRSLGKEPDKENGPLLMLDAGLRTDSRVGFPSYPVRGSTRIF